MVSPVPVPLLFEPVHMSRMLCKSSKVSAEEERLLFRIPFMDALANNGGGTQKFPYKKGTERCEAALN